jgi:hypothetical protein
MTIPFLWPLLCEGAASPKRAAWVLLYSPNSIKEDEVLDLLSDPEPVVEAIDADILDFPPVGTEVLIPNAGEESLDGQRRNSSVGASAARMSM